MCIVCEVKSVEWFSTGITRTILVRSRAGVTRLGDLSPFGQLFKVLGDNLFGPNRPNFWRLFGRFLKVGQNLKFLCYKIIFKAVNFQKKYFLKYFEKKLGNFFSKKDPKYAFLATKTSKNWVGDFGRLFSLHWATFYSNHIHPDQSNRKRLCVQKWIEHSKVVSIKEKA